MVLPSRSRWIDVRACWPLMAVWALSFCVRLIPALAAGLTSAPNYDPSVYYAAAVGFFSGRLPYRDFLLLHPPGIVLLLQPFAALGAWLGDPLGLAVTRVAFMVIGALSAVLVYVLLRDQGRLAALVGAGFYAVYPVAAHVERAPWLEAPASLLLLAALVTLRRASASGGTERPWRPVVAGVLLGLATLTKLWGAALLVAVLVWLLVTRGVRAALLGVLGAAAAGVVVLAPFVTALPQLWNDVVVAQVQRPATRTAALVRVTDILAPDFGQASPLLTAVGVLLCVLVLAAAITAASTAAGRLPAILLVVAVAVLLASPGWYPKSYPAFAAAPLALVLGSATAVWAGRLRRRGRSVVAAIASVLVLVAATVQLGSRDGFSFPGAELGELLTGRAGCVTTDHPVALILTNRLRADLGRGCPLVVDLSGYIHVLDGSPQRRENPAFQRVMMDYLGGGKTTVIMSGMWPGDFAPENRKLVESWPVVGSADRILVRQPVP